VRFWPFRAKTEAKQERPLERRLDDLERRIELLDVEWSEWYDKYRRLYARISKRAERDEKGPESLKDAPKPTNGAQLVQTPAGAPRRNLRGF